MFNKVIILFVVLIIHTGYCSEYPAGLLGIWHLRDQVIEVKKNKLIFYDMTQKSLIKVDIKESSDNPSFVLQSDSTALLIWQGFQDRFMFKKINNNFPVKKYSLYSLLKNKNPEINFEIFWQTFKENYGFFEKRHVNWDVSYALYRPQVNRRTSQEKLSQILADMVEPLHDPHVAIQADGRDYYYPLAADHILIDSSLNDFHKIFDLYENNAMKEGNAGYLLGQSRMKRYVPVIQQNYLSINDVVRKTCNDMIQYAKINDSIAYILVLGACYYSTKSDEVSDNIVALKQGLDMMAEYFSGIKAFIIDVRFHEGGYDQLSLDFAERFFTHKAIPLTKQTYFNGSYSELMKYEINPENKKVFHPEKICVLTSNLTVSGGEILYHVLRATGKVVTVGEKCAGAYSNALSKALPNGWTFTISHEIRYDYEGMSYEVIPKIPDYELPIDTKDFDAGKDRILEKSIEILQMQP